jgi:hypothetical protein
MISSSEKPTGLAVRSIDVPLQMEVVELEMLKET